MSEYENLLLEAYRGEVFGEAFFGALADIESDETQREKWRTLQQVEARTASRLQPLIEAAGIDPRDQQSTVEDGELLAEDVRDQPWPAFLEGLRSALPAFLEKFERLQSIADDRQDPILADLVAHEQAIDRFAALELAGSTDVALDVLRDHLRQF